MTTLKAWLKDAQGNRLKEVELSCDAQGNLFIAAAIGASTFAEQQTQSGLLVNISNKLDQAATVYVDANNTLVYRAPGGVGWVDANGDPFSPALPVQPAVDSKNYLIETHDYSAINPRPSFNVDDLIVVTVRTDLNTGIAAQAWFNVTQGLPLVLATMQAAVSNGDILPAVSTNALLSDIRNHRADAEYIITTAVVYCTAGNSNFVVSPSKETVHIQIYVESALGLYGSDEFKVSLDYTGNGYADSTSCDIALNNTSLVYKDAGAVFNDIYAYPNLEDAVLYVVEKRLVQ